MSVRRYNCNKSFAYKPGKGFHKTVPVDAVVICMGCENTLAETKGTGRKEIIISMCQSCTIQRLKAA